jgi:hypothetical protein
VAYPITKRYFLRWRHEDSGLTPTFTYFNNASTFAPISQPTISEVNGVGLGNGSYYFDYTYSSATDPSVIFEVDGGASIPTEEIRYISDNIGPSDTFLDENISTVHTDVWGDNTSYSAGTKGYDVALLPGINTETGYIGTPADAVNAATVFGQIYETQATLALIEGSGFVSASDSLAAIAGGIQPAEVASAVWDALLSSHTVSNSFGALLGGIMAGQLTRALGMMHENSVLDLTTFDVNNNLTSGRLRTYSTPTDAIAAQAASPAAYTTNMIAQYAITATYTGSNLTTYLVDRTA